jgi:hypothetical protein
LNSNGNWLWAKKAGGTDIDQGHSIAVDNLGNSYITGSFQDIAVFGSIILNCTTLTDTDYDIFVSELDTNGNWLWAENAGGSGFDRGQSICVDNVGNQYIAGRFESVAVFGTEAVISNGLYDVFVAKFGDNTISTDEQTTPDISANLHGNYPNPFNFETNVSYSVKGTKQLRIEIYNTKGQLICTLLNEMKTTGNYSVVWNGINDKGESVPSGIYFYKMTSGNSSSSKKMVLID